MIFTLKNETSEDLVYVAVRMSNVEYEALRTYMHCPAGEVLKFPYGAVLNERTCGWYRITSPNNKRAIDKIKFAIVCLKRFLADEEEKTVEALKLLVPSMMNPGVQLAAFSSFHAPRDLVYLGNPQPPAPASKSKLDALVRKFK